MIGRKIRILRKNKGFTLKDISEKTGFSISFISQLERDKVNPTVSSLKIICDSLDVSLVSIFDEKKFDELMENSMVVRKENRLPLTSKHSEAELYLLTPNIDNKMEMILIVAKPGASSGNEFHRHEGEECGIILKGTFVGETETNIYTLNEGDCFYLKSNQLHKWYNNSDEECISIWVISPPSF